MRADLETRIREAFADDADTALHFIGEVARARGVSDDVVAMATLAKGADEIARFRAAQNEVLATHAAHRRGLVS